MGSIPNAAKDFRVAMLTKPPYPSFNQFVISLQNNEQICMTTKEEEKKLVDQDDLT